MAAWQIPLMVKPPQTMGLNDIIQAQQSRQAFQTNQQTAQLQQQAMRQEIQQRDIDMRENQGVKDAITSAYQNGKDISDPETIGAIMQASPTRGAVIQKTLLDNKKTIQEIQNSALEHDTKTAGFIAQTLNSVKDQDTYAGALAALHASHVDTSAMPPQYDPDTVQNWIQKGTTLQEQLNQAKEKREAAAAKTTQEKEQQALAVAKRQQGIQELSGVTDEPSRQAWAKRNPQLAAELPTYDTAKIAELQTEAVPVASQPEYQIKKTEEAMMSAMKPGDWAQQLDAAIRDPKLKQTTAALLMSAPTWQAKQAVLKEAATQQSTLDRETNPGVIQARVNQQVATQRALYNGNAAVGSVPPHLVVPASAAYEKSGKDYANAISAQQEMDDFIQLAKKGNVEGYSYLPTTGVLTINSANGSKRVNLAEIQQYGGAGSAYDKLKGWVGKQVSGKSIPDNILDAMGEVHDTLGEVAAQKHANEVKAVNQTYGSTFAPMQLTPATGAKPPAAKPAQGGYIVGRKYAGGLTYQGGDPNDRASWK